jgi:DNA-binding NarL/FixJ family response regulator
MPIQVIIADDHQFVLDAIFDLLALDGDIEVVSRCRNGQEAVSAAERHPDAVLVLDIRMKGLDGWNAMRELRGRRTGPILVCSGTVDANDILRAARLGAKGVFLKEMKPELLGRFIREVHAGASCFAAALTELSAEPLEPGDIGQLTAREIDVLRLVALGLRNREIADRIGIQEGTVRIHLHRIYRKLGTNSRVNLATYAQDLGLG